MLKARAVRMVAEVRGDHDWKWAAMSKVARCTVEPLVRTQGRAGAVRGKL